MSDFQFFLMVSFIYNAVYLDRKTALIYSAVSLLIAICFLVAEHV